MGGQQQHLFGEACSGSEQAVEVSGLPQFIESAQGGEDPLAYAAVVTGVLDDLQILAWSGLFDAEEHGGLLAKDTTILTSKTAETRAITTNPS